eukprot:6989809-Prymnesium_polylepis.3
MSLCLRSTLDGAINSNDPIAEPYPPKNHSKTNGTPGKEQHDQEAMIVEPAIMTVERAVPMFAQSVIVESSGSDPVTSILAAAGKSSALFDVGGPFGSLEKAHVISIEKVSVYFGGPDFRKDQIRPCVLRFRVLITAGAINIGQQRGLVAIGRDGAPVGIGNGPVRVVWCRCKLSTCRGGAAE